MRIVKSFRGWTLDKKMTFLLTIIIVLTTSVILAAATFSSFVTMDRQSMNMAWDQLDTLAVSLDEELNRYNSLIYALQMDKSIQNYLTNISKESLDALTLSANYSVSSVANTHENVNFIVIWDADSDRYIIRGNGKISVMRIFQKYQEDFEQSYDSGYGTLKVNYSPTYLWNGEYSLNLYQPIYAIRGPIREIGSFVMNVESPILRQITERSLQKGKSQVMLTTLEGRILSQSRSYRTGTMLLNEGMPRGTKGSFRDRGKTYLYQKVGNWDFYLVDELSYWELYERFLNVLVFLVTLIVTMTIVALVLMRNLIKKLYQPLDYVLSKMDCVSEGQINVRIHGEHMGQDFERLSSGFNSMMDEINVLMEKVKLEQHQMEEIRFNALQSQIKPHFLYNTLECIHWQAAAEGSKEISTMVKALAQYYRICLSKGKDIIPLSMELDHIRNYLIIQNMRYDNIIQSDIWVDKAYYELDIPKMTLQPLVENSIYHGLKVKDGCKGTITIRVEHRADKICILVEDDGQGMTDAEIEEMNASISIYENNFGYGVRNVNKRIELLYGSEYGLHYRSNAMGGVTVEIMLPDQRAAGNGGRCDV